MANPREGRNVSTVIRCAMDPDNACSSAQLCSTPRCQQNLGSLATFGCVVQSRERCPFCCGCVACDARFSNYEKRVLVAARYSEAGSGSSRGTSPSTSSPSTSASLTGTAAAPTSSAIASNPGGGASSTLPSGASEIVAMEEDEFAPPLTPEGLTSTFVPSPASMGLMVLKLARLLLVPACGVAVDGAETAILSGCSFPQSGKLVLMVGVKLKFTCLSTPNHTEQHYHQPLVRSLAFEFP